MAEISYEDAIAAPKPGEIPYEAATSAARVGGQGALPKAGTDDAGAPYTPPGFLGRLYQDYVKPQIGAYTPGAAQPAPEMAPSDLGSPPAPTPATLATQPVGLAPFQRGTTVNLDPTSDSGGAFLPGAPGTHAPETVMPAGQNYWTGTLPNAALGGLRAGLGSVATGAAEFAGPGGLGLVSNDTVQRVQKQADAGNAWQAANYPVATANENLFSRIVGQGGSLAPLVAAGAISTPLLLAAAGTQIYDNTYRDAEKHGATPEQAGSAALKSAILDTGLFALPVGGALVRGIEKLAPSLQPGFTRFAIKLAGNGLGFETAVEATKFVDNYIAKTSYDPNRPLTQGLGDKWDENTIVGMLLGIPHAKGDVRAGYQQFIDKNRTPPGWPNWRQSQDWNFDYAPPGMSPGPEFDGGPPPHMRGTPPPGPEPSGPTENAAGTSGPTPDSTANGAGTQTPAPDSRPLKPIVPGAPVSPEPASDGVAAAEAASQQARDNLAASAGQPTVRPDEPNPPPPAPKPASENLAQPSAQPSAEPRAEPPAPMSDGVPNNVPHETVAPPAPAPVEPPPWQAPPIDQNQLGRMLADGRDPFGTGELNPDPALVQSVADERVGDITAFLNKLRQMEELRQQGRSAFNSDKQLAAYARDYQPIRDRAIKHIHDLLEPVRDLWGDDGAAEFLAEAHRQSGTDPSVMAEPGRKFDTESPAPSTSPEPSPPGNKPTESPVQSPGAQPAAPKAPRGRKGASTSPSGESTPPPQAPPAEPPPLPEGFGSTNTIFTKDKYDEAAAKLREMFGRLNAGFDPEIAKHGFAMAGYYIEGGLREFGAFAKQILGTLGEGARPYLGYWYDTVRRYPGFDGTGMTSPEDVARMEAENIHGRGAAGPGNGGLDQTGGGQTAPAGGGAGKPAGGSGPGDVAPGAPQDGGEPTAGGPPEAGGNGPGASDAGVEGGIHQGGVGADGLGGRGDEGVASAGAGGRKPEPVTVRPNFHIDDPESLIGGTPKVRFARNRAALEALTNIEAEQRDPTGDELRTMAGYIGWGSFGQDLFQGTFDYQPKRPGWDEEGKWLREHLGRENWESARDSILNSHYTDPITVKAMWDSLQAMGFKGGRILEPSLGIGNFFGLMPRDIMAKSDLTGIELDKVTASMAKLLYPHAGIHQKGYEESRTPDGFYDLVVGNWPFAAQSPPDRRYDKLSPSLHDYFFLKALDQTRPGGLVMGITSSGTMDKMGRAARLALADKGELLAAYRLPSGAFEKYAGTSVVTDLLVFRKRAAPPPTILNEPWLDATEMRTPQGSNIRVNNFYQDHPENVLGTLDFGHGTTQGRAGMIVHRPPDILQRLQGLPALMPPDGYHPLVRGNEPRFLINNGADRQNSIVKGQDGNLYQVQGERLARLDDITALLRSGTKKEVAAKTTQVHALVDMRKAYGALIDFERDGSGETEGMRRVLNKQYQDFVAKHGKLADSPGLRVLDKLQDPAYPMLRALERPDGTPAAILTEPTIRSVRRLGDNPSVADAYVAARNESLHLDMNRVAALAKQPVDVVAKQLLDSGAVFRTPGGGYEPGDTYLSGNVRIKLAEAKQALANGEDMGASVAALTARVPETVPYYKIEPKLGAPWIGDHLYEQFLAELLGRKDTEGIHVRFAGSRWKVGFSDRSINHTPEAQTLHGHPRRPFNKIAMDAMGNATAKIIDHTDDGDFVNEQATEEVNAKISELREKFQDWAFADPERKLALETAYNDIMNAIAKPKFDGSFMDMSGMALRRGEDPFSLRQHQVNAIWRGVVTGRGLFAHEVGTGKTFTMGGIAVEGRRYGTFRKPLLFAHNANSAAVAREIQEMYPGAKVLYLESMPPKQVQTALRRVSNDDWDLVVMPHSLIDRMALKRETLMELAAEQIAELEAEAMEAAQDDGAALTVEMMNDTSERPAWKRIRSVTAKELVRQRNAILANIEKQANRSSREDVIPFEDLGVDAIMVDEAHEFKKPPLSTRMRVKGLNTEANNKSIALNFLTSYVKRNANGKGVYLFTGTPLTNALNEAFNIGRYFMNDRMAQGGFDSWDTWFNNFAQADNVPEITAAGTYEPVTRLNAFDNIDELVKVMSEFTDVVQGKDMPEFTKRATPSGKVLGDPTLTPEEHEFLLNGRTKNPTNRPYKRVINHDAPMTPHQEAILELLRERAQSFKDAPPLERREILQSRAPNNDPRSPIVIEGDLAKASMDARMFSPDAPEHAQNKLNRVAAAVLSHYQEPGAGQAIFMDTGYGVSKASEGRADRFVFLNDLIAKLVAGVGNMPGIPRNQIAVVGGGIEGIEKDNIARAMNAGTLRVVIGRSDTLGVGVNMQKNLRAMHHVDAPWRPGDLEQRNGRGERAGNEWNTVLEYRYITEGMDGRRWQVLAGKDRFIKKFVAAFNDESGERLGRIEGAGADVGDSEDILATLGSAAGDGRIPQREKLRMDVNRLERRERSHVQGQAEAAHQVRMITAELARGSTQQKRAVDRVATWEAAAERAQALGAAAGDTTNRWYEGDVGGVPMHNWTEINDALEAQAAAMKPGDGVRVLGTVNGFQVEADWSDNRGKGLGFAKEPNYWLLDAGGEHIDGMNTPKMTSITARVASMRNEIDHYNKMTEEMTASLPRMEKAWNEPFPQAAQLELKRQQFDDIERDLMANPVPPPSWLRNGAPLESEIYVDGQPRVVEGHRAEADDYYLVTDQGSVPYLDAKDENGLPIFEDHGKPKPAGPPPHTEPFSMQIGSIETTHRAEAAVELDAAITKLLPTMAPGEQRKLANMSNGRFDLVLENAKDGPRLLMQHANGDRRVALPGDTKAAIHAAEDLIHGTGEQDDDAAPMPSQRLPLYSPVERAVAGLKQERGTGEQMLAAISKTPGVKPEELQWIGLPDWLRGQAKVSKADIADFVRANQLQVHEITYGTDHEASDAKIRAANDAVWDAGTRIQTALQPHGHAVRIFGETYYHDDIMRGVVDGALKLGAVPAEFGLRAAAAEYVDAIRARDAAEVEADAAYVNKTNPRYSDYQLSGGENYRELLITLPPKGDAGLKIVSHPTFDETMGRGFALQRPDGSYVMNAGHNPQPKRWDTREYAEQGLNIYNNKEGSHYVSPHWEAPNVLAHVRFSERQLGGKRILHIEETQSDMHQAGRKHGYVDAKKPWQVFDPTKHRETVAAFATEAEARAYAHSTDRPGGFLDYWNGLSEHGGVPDAPFKTTWPALVMKRMIAYAVEHGFDRVVWSPGDVHADRYSLAKAANYVAWHPVTGQLSFERTKGEGFEHVNGVTPAKLPDYIGKELAERMAQTTPNENGMHELEGDDLKVGGAGMRGFYDRILPAEVNKIIGKFGAKVGRHTIATGTPLVENDRPARVEYRSEEEPFGNPYALIDNDTGDVIDVYHSHEVAAQHAQEMGYTLAEPDKLLDVHGFDVTDAMREAVGREGLPLFQKEATTPAGDRPTREAVQAMIDAVRDMTGGKVHVQVHERPDGTYQLTYRDGSTADVDAYALGRLIRVALGPEAEMGRNMTHEILHALRNLGVFRPGEWAALEAAAKRLGWEAKYRIAERYPQHTPELRTEEAIAEAMADAKHNPPSSLLARMLAKIRAFFDKIRNWYNDRGFQSVDDVFQRVFSGEVGAREPGSGGAHKQRGPTSVRESIRQADTFDGNGEAPMPMARRGPRLPPGQTPRRAMMNLARQAADDIQKGLAPTSRGPGAKQMEHLIRGNRAEIAQATMQSTDALQQFGNMIGRLPADEQLAITDRREVGVRQPTPELSTVINALVAEQNKWRGRIQSLGPGYLDNAIQNYLGHIWGNYDEWRASQPAPTQAEMNARARAAGVGKSPLKGSGNFLKQRTFATQREGMNAGLVPVTTNPIEMQLLKLREMQKFYYGVKLADDIKDSGLSRWVPFHDEAAARKEGLVKLDDVVFQPRVVDNQNDPDAQYGRREFGNWYAPEEVARIFNNFVSGGWAGKSVIYDSVRQVGNAMNTTQLGLSGFHATFIAFDTMMSKMALGMEQLARGDAARGLGNIAIGASPHNIVTTVMKGSALRQAYLHPNRASPAMQKLVRAMVQGGGRAKMDPFYQSNAAGSLFKRLGDFKDPKGVMHDVWETLNSSPIHLVGVARLFGRALDTISQPIMGFMVPRAKMGVFSMLASDWMRAHPNATEAQSTAAMTKFWDSVDNRMGQLVYDNLFWNKTLKDVAFITTRSVGWNLGSVREVAGGMVDGAKMVADGVRLRKPEFTTRLAYALSMPILTAIYGAVLTYLLTGEGPKEILDYFYPRSGTFSNGQPDRLSLPGYTKDVVAASHDLTGTLLNKTHPLIETAKELIINRDYYGGIINMPGIDNPFASRGAFLAKQFLPFSIRGGQKSQRQGAGVLGTGLNALGIQPAPQSVVNPAKGEAFQRREDLSAYRRRLREEARP